jgi:hypothetical protein
MAYGLWLTGHDAAPEASRGIGTVALNGLRRPPSNQPLQLQLSEATRLRDKESYPAMLAKARYT